ncbi:MAG: hypothetical protein JWO01_2797 [Microbacteriaceae bacterium]|nr:hypothetical protein [Microbacteriaceae bacterium]
MAVNLTCPHCHATFYNQVIRKHGLIRCGKCGKTIRI